MNWLKDTPPYQFNYQHRGQLLLWNGSDQEQLYRKNLSQRDTRLMIESLRWDKIEITYRYNSHGFRCDEFDDRPCALALGCSFTEGTGLPIEMTWPTYLSELLDIHVWNLGSGGGTIDTVFRMLEYYIDKLHPRMIFILIPPQDRLEYCSIDNGYPILSINDMVRHPSFAKEWLTQTKNGEYITRKTLLAIEKICDNFSVPVILEGNEWQSISPYRDLARDLMHRGPVYQQRKARTFFNRVQNSGQVI